MRIVDFIVKYIEDSGMTQTEAADMAGWSRQNYWDKLNNRNPRFNSILHILNSLGFELHVVREDDTETEFDEKDFFEVVKKRNTGICDLEDILQSTGHKFEIVKMPEE